MTTNQIDFSRKSDHLEMNLIWNFLFWIKVRHTTKLPFGTLNDIFFNKDSTKL